MYPTLNNFTNSQYREFGLMNTHKSHFKRGDIIVFDRSNDGSGDYLVKRVIGLPNETIKITDGGGAALADYIDISYDGSTFRLDESYLTDVAKTSTYAGAFATYSPLTLSENQYFLMGDNRANSQDSRMIGPIDKTQITGKLLVLYGYAENVLTETDGNGQVMNTLVNKHYYSLWEMRFFLMSEQNIHWFPGHMQKALRDIENKLKVIDVVVELADSRAPLYSTRNPILAEKSKNKQKLLVLTKLDLADENRVKQAVEELKTIYDNVLAGNLNDRGFIRQIKAAVKMLGEPVHKKQAAN